MESEGTAGSFCSLFKSSARPHIKRYSNAVSLVRVNNKQNLQYKAANHWRLFSCERSSVIKSGERFGTKLCSGT